VSFATPEKKNKEMTTSQGGSPSSATFEEKKKMMRSFLACHHLLHLRREKNKEMTTSQGGLPSFVTFEKKNKQMKMSLLACHHLLHLRKKIKMIVSQEACRHLLHLRKKPRDLFSPCIFQLLTLCAQICLKDKDQLGGLSSFFRTQEKPTSRFFSLGCRGGLCTFTYHRCTNYLLEERFLQHHFNNIFCSISSTPLL